MTLRVAVVGCCHGALDIIFQTAQADPSPPDLIIISGDFQSIRNKADLQCIAVPAKYLQEGDFPDYYSGKKTAPIPTLFVGGNHEASNYLDELKYGGWVAPNIYYLGLSGVVWYQGLRITGISGIWKPMDFVKKREETIPYDQASIRSIYHVRNIDFLKLRLMRTSGGNLQERGLVISHDWPQRVTDHQKSVIPGLLRKKKHFKAEIESGNLGSPVNKNLLQHLRPEFWISAHLHVFLKIHITWINNSSGKRRASDGKNDVPVVAKKASLKNSDEIEIDLDDLSDDETEDIHAKEPPREQITKNNDDEIELEISEEEDDKDDSRDNEGQTKKNTIIEELKPKLGLIQNHQDSPPPTKSTTTFIALDKPLPRRQFLSFIDVEVTSKDHISFLNKDTDPRGTLYHDVEFACISYVVNKREYQIHSALKRSIGLSLNPPLDLIQELRSEVDKRIETLCLDDKVLENSKIMPSEFVRTASCDETELKVYQNPQTNKYIKNFLNQTNA